MSWVIQNEILDCVAKMVCNDVIKEVKGSQILGPFADATKDPRKKEGLSFVQRYCYAKTVNESSATSSKLINWIQYT